MRRELTDEELGTSAVQKLLMDELERLEAECGASKIFETKYHERDKDAVLFEEKLKRNVSSDVFFGGSLTIGAALMTYSSSLWSLPPAGWIILVLGALLMASGIAARVILK